MHPLTQNYAAEADQKQIAGIACETAQMGQK